MAYAADMAAKPVLRPDPSSGNFAHEEEGLAADAEGALDCLGIARLSAATLADALWQVPAPSIAVRWGRMIGFLRLAETL